MQHSTTTTTTSQQHYKQTKLDHFFSKETSPQCKNQMLFSAIVLFQFPLFVPTFSNFNLFSVKSSRFAPYPETRNLSRTDTEQHFRSSSSETKYSEPLLEKDPTTPLQTKQEVISFNLENKMDSYSLSSNENINKVSMTQSDSSQEHTCLIANQTVEIHFSSIRNNNSNSLN
jgi:hypothetical protein